jgi:hypothetical protein
MGNFNFRDLSLSGVQASSGTATLPPGRYLCTIKEAKIEPTSNGGSQMVVSLVADGKGSIKDWIGIYNPNSSEAQRINRERLKALLVHGGHADPDNIGSHGVESMKGLKVGVAVRSESYKDKSGNDKVGSRVHYYFDKNELGAAPAGAGGGVDGLEDDIPF